MKSEKEILNNLIKKYDLNLDDNFKYVGATIVKKSNFPNYTEILFCEDGFNDEKGMPYIMQGLFSKEYKKDRIIVFYNSNLERFLVPVDEENWSLIGYDVPEEVKRIDYGKAKKIMHRKTLEMDNKVIKLTDKEKQDLYKLYIKRYKKGRMIAAGIIASLVWLILFFLIVVFVGSSFDGSDAFPLILLLASCFIGFIVCSFFTIKFFVKLPAKIVKGINYRHDFMVLDFAKATSLENVGEYFISGYTYDGEICKLLTYGVSHYDSNFIKDMKYFEVINLYSKSPDFSNFEYRLFLKK